MRKAVQVVLFITFLFYTAGVLSGKSFNPFEWSYAVRETVSAFWVVFTLIGMLFQLIITTANSKD